MARDISADMRSSLGKGGYKVYKVQTDILMLTGATPMRLVSMLVSSPKLTAKEKPKGLMRNGDKNGLDSGSVRIMLKTLQLHEQR